MGCHHKFAHYIGSFIVKRPSGGYYTNILHKKFTALIHSLVFFSAREPNPDASRILIRVFLHNLFIISWNGNFYSLLSYFSHFIPHPLTTCVDNSADE